MIHRWRDLAATGSDRGGTSWGLAFPSDPPLVSAQWWDLAVPRNPSLAALTWSLPRRRGQPPPPTKIGSEGAALSAPPRRLTLSFWRVRTRAVNLAFVREVIGRAQGVANYQLRHPDGRVTTVPFHVGRDISPTLLRQIARDLGLSIEEFLGGPHRRQAARASRTPAAVRWHDSAAFGGRARVYHWPGLAVAQARAR